MNKSIIKALYFDLDHTLWDFEKNSARAFKTLFKQYEIGLKLDAFLEVYVPNNTAYWRLYREGKIDKEKLRYERLKTVFDRLHYQTSDALIYDMADAYIQTLPEYNSLFPGAITILDALKPHYALHMITNGFKDVQHFKMKNSGLLPYFETVTDSSSVGKKKPDPEIFNHALKVGGVSPEQAVMIGDSLEADVQGALNVGMHAVHFMPLARKNPTHYKEIEQLDELTFLI
ncbi:MAG: YjjG family noncanonical pyrimidine nucleotidase [Flavobacteriaceae bacterium]|jgi:putative hydrolase of the HAD superfamily|nr:YjjG family noncanonical pyrimidine nucleotidase [Flavobacteriaceae bacterium]MDG2290752.1 YjjG family noncanonical pyrimidine nucleotidase [Flavobacteriaceae bacterium]